MNYQSPPPRQPTGRRHGRSATAGTMEHHEAQHVAAAPATTVDWPTQGGNQHRTTTAAATLNDKERADAKARARVFLTREEQW